MADVGLRTERYLLTFGIIVFIVLAALAARMVVGANGAEAPPGLRCNSQGRGRIDVRSPGRSWARSSMDIGSLFGFHRDFIAATR